MSSGELGLVPLSDSDSTTVGDYVLTGRLGSGGMGMVYLARSASGRQVAVKLVHAQYAENEEFRMRFRQEIAAARRVSGAFTAPVLDADPEAERPWMATLFVPGPTLAQRVKEGGPLVDAELRTLALGLSEALRDIHRAGVVHRDLKPSNVLMAQDGPRVIDFGISRVADNQALTVTGQALGTPPFMSPEQLTSTRDVGPASDVFSLGAVLVFATCGRGPFDSDSSYTTAYNVAHEPPVLDGVAEPLLSILVRCLDKDPDLRPVPAELLRLFQTLPTRGTAHTHTVVQPAVTAGVVTGPTVRRRPEKPAGRRPGRRVLLVSLTAVLALTGLGLAVAFWPGGSGAGGAAAGADPTASRSPEPELPDGWRPWRTTLRTQTPPDASSNVNSGCLGSGNAMYCGGEGFTAARLNAATGKAVWRFSAGVESSAPVLVRDDVVVVNDLRGPAWSTDEHQWVTGLHKDNGKVSWTHSVADGSRAVPFGAWVVAPSVDGRHLIAMNAGDGDEAWRFSVPAGESCDHWLGGGVMYAFCSPPDAQSGRSGMWRFDPSDGEAHRVGEVPANTRPVGVDEDELVLLEYPVDTEGVPGRSTSVLRVHTSTGETRRVALPEEGRVARADRVRLFGETLYPVRGDGKVAAISARTGAVRWQRDTKLDGLSAPVLSRTYGALYFVNDDGRLLALETATGEEQWRTPAQEGAAVGTAAGPPQVYLKRDAIVAHAGGLTFSVDPLDPAAAVE